MKDLRVEDVMTRQVVTIRPDEPLKDLVRLMRDHGVGGVPVVDEDDRLTGIVSEADLLRATEEREPKPRSLLLEWFVDRKTLEEIERQSADVRARDVMTRKVITVRPDTPVEHTIGILLREGVRRLPVVDADDRVVGIVTRRDLLSPFLRDDGEIRREIQEDVILETMWIDPTTLEVEVEEGVVRLRGEVDRRSTKEITVDMVHRVDGVVGVENELTYRTDDRGTRPPAYRSPDVVGGSPDRPDYASRD